MPRNRVQKPVGPRASVGVALIVKDMEHTLGACLDSIRPYVEQIVVCVDDRSTDKSAKVARQHGADIIKPVKVSDWHECARHGKVLAQHFADARNESFKYLNPDLDWWLWIDADDVLEHGDQMKRILDGVPGECIGVWLPYRYATLAEGKATTTVFHRERFLRTKYQGKPVKWDWVYRVHEVVKADRDGGWYGTSEIDIWHQEGKHKVGNSAERNLLLLEIDGESDPNDSRTIFYIGNQYFAMGDNANAARWYMRLLQGNGGNDYERWQAAVYMGHANLRMGNLHEATQSAYLALEEHPEHPEPYFLLASVAYAGGKWAKVGFWTKLGRTMKEPPFFVFKNPMDYHFNNRLPLADSLAAEGYIDAALEEWEAAHAYYQDERVASAIDKAKHIQEAIKAADRYVTFATYTNGASHDLAIAEYERLPEDVRSLGRVRDVAVPLMLARRPATQPRIVFWCGKSWEEWAPPVLETTGIGGSETAVIEIGRRFASDGWRVDVYNDAGRFEGVYDGVGYWNCERETMAKIAVDVLEANGVWVTWRQPGMWPGGGKSILWCHDLNYGPQKPSPMFDKIVGVSQWHADMLRRYYDLPEDKVGYVPNGIDLGRFRADVARVPMRCVYASSPDRGLVRLLGLWPQIRKAEPEAELHIAYGWDTIDRMIQAGRKDLADFKAHVQGLLDKSEGVVWCGRLSQDKLAELYGSAYAWTYPTSFLEVSCISAMEAMAGGAVPVVSAAGALKETVGDAGIVTPGLPESRHWQEFWLLQVLGVLTDPNLRHPLSIRGKTRAAALTWDVAYKSHWKPLVEDLLGGDNHAATKRDSDVYMNEPEATCA